MSRSNQKTIDDLRESRLHALRTTSPEHQLDRLKPLEHQLELALARVAGTKLAPIVINRMLESLLLHPEILIHISGSEMAELPSNAEGWNAFAHDAIKTEPLAVLCIESRDATRREELKQIYIAGLKLTDRITKARDGTLDAAAESYVVVELQRSAGL
ncbi:MAG: hypothetical protein JWS10_1717 [Cypionkella sp.]|uniref:hypothetical protein n=1 Tax=Cypionkella sp. TaxID=2811411 RepID=UPI00263460DD|nr:hypothetical protein [Cypionkella sp.]MDB5659102.1 hypothetical protein [Cypionkella sp.]